MPAIGESVGRREAPSKVAGAAKYNGDFSLPSLLYAHLATSPHAHARIVSVDTRPALGVPGVLAAVTGEDTSLLCGEVLEDRPPLARGKVRYDGEPVAVVVAHDEASAIAGARAVEVAYEALPAVNSPVQALEPGAPLVHEDLGLYRVAQMPVHPEPGSNVADRARIRKGDLDAGWRESEVTVEGTFSLPQVDHAAMETRSARAEILPDGRVIVHTSSQAPFEVQKLLARWFALDPGQVIVNAPLVGGAFGGKAAVQLEVIAYLASRAVGGRPVKLVNTREQDITSSPVGMGLEARVRMGATQKGRITALSMTFLMDAGAYADSSPRVARAIAAGCTGPYRVDNVSADVLVVYTNHTYATAWRGFGHMPLTFVVERMMDRLARTLRMDPLELREANLLAPGDTTPTRVRLTTSRLGDPRACARRLRELIGWDGGQGKTEPDGKVRAQGAAFFWKTSSSDPNAISGAVLSLNVDGTVNLATGAVEFGPGTKTTVAQILADALRTDVRKVHVHMAVNTQTDPVHWKTVASVSTFMIGRAILQAAEDVLAQLKAMASIVLRCPAEDLDAADGRVFLRDDPSVGVEWKDIAHGYVYDTGDAVGGQIIGKGTFIMRHLTPLDQATGEGRPGPAWTVGAQAVDVRLDPRTHTYQILRAATVLDAGKVVNPMGARGAVTGGMAMGLGYGSRESILRSDRGEVLTRQFRTYKVMRFGETPLAYLVDFVETPQLDAPFGARPVGEHGVLGMPAALANALSAAAGVGLDRLPLTPEAIWRAKGDGR